MVHSLRAAWQLILLVFAFIVLGHANVAMAQPSGDAGTEPAPEEAADDAGSEAPAEPKPAPAPASDIDDEPPPVTAKTKAQAKMHFKRGLRLLGEEAWSPALAEFLKSRELYPTRVATNNVGIALRKLQRYDEALEMFETFLRDFKVPDEERQAAQVQIAELRGLVGTIDIVGAEPGASIVVSSVDRGEYPPVSPIRVPAGTHVVRVVKDGYEPFETRVDVAGGAIASVQAKMAQLRESGMLRVFERGGKKLDVVVDGVIMGLSPWQGRVGVGEHMVLLRGPGKIGTQPARAVVKSEERTQLTLVAEELGSQLRVDPNPPGATVSIDGVDVGSGVWLGRLRTGSHKVLVRADGFLDSEKTLELKAGQRDTVAIELERDDDAPMWRKPPKWVVDGTAGFVVMPTFGGDVADACTGDCSSAPGVGAVAMAHGGYELGNGLGFGLELGYFLAAQNISGRSAGLRPNGLSDADLNAGTADDNLRMQGFMAGATVGYHLSDDISVPVLFRVGAGVLVGQVRNERNGTFNTRGGDPYSTFPVAAFSSATYFYADPSIRAGFRFAENWELTGIVQAILLVGITQPKFDNAIEVGASNDGIGTYSDETLMGSFVVAISPGANIRYQF
jgi:PEGA domain